MEIKLIDKNNTFEQNLRSKINVLANPVFFDITMNGVSEQILALSETGIYKFSYSRPLIMNLLKPPLAEYEFHFKFQKDKFTNVVNIFGKFKFKQYILGSMLFVLIIISWKIYDTIFQSAPFSILFLIVAPVVLLLYLLVEYFIFSRRVRAFLSSLTN